MYLLVHLSFKETYDKTYSHELLELIKNARDNQTSKSRKSHKDD